MRIFGIHFNFGRNPAGPRATAGAAVLQRSATGSVEDWLQGNDLDRPMLTNAYQQSAWVYRAVNVLAEQVANIPFLFSAGDRGREHLITSGPLLDFYNRPHPYINRFQYWELRVIWLMLRGECFRIPVYEESRSPSSARKLKQVLMLDPAHFHHIVSNHQLVGWRYTGFGPRAPLAAQVFLPEEVWFERLPNPFDFWRGLPPLYAAAMAAHTDYAASAFMRGLIENNCDTGLIVRTEKPLGDEQDAQLKAALNNRKRAAGAADRPLLLSGVNEIIRPELSSSDLQFLENRKFSRAEICAAFGVPEEILTATDHAKYDVMQGARLNFIENRVAPLCHRLEAEEEATVSALDANAVGWFDLDSLPIMQQAQRNRLVAARTAFEMGVPFNELNRVLDLGFKRLPWGDKGYVTGTMQNVGENSTPASASAGRNSNSEKTEVDPITRAVDWFNSPLDKTAPGEATPEPVPIFINAAAKHPANPTHTPARKKVRRFLFEQRSAVLQRLAELRKTAASETARDPKTLRGGEAIQASDLFDVTAETTKLKSLLQAHGLDGELALKLNQSILAGLAASLRRSIEKRETFEKLTARVRAIYNQAADEEVQNLQRTLAPDGEHPGAGLEPREVGEFGVFPFGNFKSQI